MALFPLKLYKISRYFFFAIAVIQALLLSKYVVDHEKNSAYYGLAAMFAIPLFYWFGTLYHNGLKDCLSVVWFLYTFVLVIMIGVIFGRMVVEDNKLREHEMATCLYNAAYNAPTATKNVKRPPQTLPPIFNPFFPPITTTAPLTTKNVKFPFWYFHPKTTKAPLTTKSPIKPRQSDSFFDSKFLKITLCFTPGQMLLLLTSVTDETEVLKQLYLTTVLNLFDGVEMLEVLHEDVCDKIPMEWEIAVLVASCLFFFLSSLEIHQVKFEKQNDVGKEEMKVRKKTAKFNAAFQIVLNLAFLVIRLVLWLHYDFNSAIFLAKNIIGLLIALVPVLEEFGVLTTESGKKTQQQTMEMGRNNLSNRQ